MIGQAQSITCESSIPETIKDTESTFILLHDAFCLRINLSCMNCSYHDRSIFKLPSSNFWIWYFAPMRLSYIQHYCELLGKWKSLAMHGALFQLLAVYEGLHRSVQMHGTSTVWSSLSSILVYFIDKNIYSPSLLVTSQVLKWLVIPTLLLNWIRWKEHNWK